MQSTCSLILKENWQFFTFDISEDLNIDCLNKLFHIGDVVENIRPRSLKEGRKRIIDNLLWGG